MIQFLCNDCKKPIDPESDNYWDIPNMTVRVGDKGARFGNMHFCCKGHLVSFLKKNAEPSNIISISGTSGPSA